jgi:hypothetical protein
VEAYRKGKERGGGTIHPLFSQRAWVAFYLSFVLYIINNKEISS